MKKTLSMLATVGALVGGATLAVAPQANAYVQSAGTCHISGVALTTRTTATTTDSGCTVRARLDRYVQNYPTSYYGSTGKSSDTGVVTVGTFVANYDIVNGTAYRVG